MQAGIHIEKSKLIGWIVTIATAIGIMCIPVSEAFIPQIRLFAMLSIAVISIVAFDLMDVIIPSVLLPFAYYVFHIVPINIAYSPFTTETFWMILGAFVLTNALEECGILMRIAYLWRHTQQDALRPVSGRAGAGHHLFLRPLPALDLPDIQHLQGHGVREIQRRHPHDDGGRHCGSECQTVRLSPGHHVHHGLTGTDCGSGLLRFLLRSDALQFPFRLDGAVVHMASHKTV